MPTQTINLVGQIDSRSNSTGYTKDQVFKGCTFKTLTNPVSGRRSVYVEKRGSMTSVGEPTSSGNFTALFASPSTLARISAVGTATSTIYKGSTSCGSLTTNYIARHISETIISGTTFYLLSACHSTGPSAGTEGWYLADDATDVTAYTADGNNSTTITDIKIAGVNSTAGLYPGQLLAAGANIAAGSRIVSVNSGAFTAVLDTATTGGAFGDLAITKTAIAKMNDADFPTNIVGEFVELSGAIYIMDTSGRIWGSDLNSVSSWSAINFLSANLYTDSGTGLAKDGDRIIGYGSVSAEWFYNAGNATGSPLSKTGRSMPIGASCSMSATPFASNISSNGQAVCWSVLTGQTRQVWMLDGGSPKKISSPMIEVLANIVNLVCLTSFSYSGERYIFMSFVSGGVNYNQIYSLDTGLWSDAAFHDALIISAVHGMAPTLNPANRGIYGAAGSTAGGSTGKVYQWNAAAYADTVGTLTASIQTGGLDFGTDSRKFVSTIWLDADTQASGTCTLEASDDDFTSFVTLGTFDMTAHEKKITRCGSHKGERSYRLTHSANTAFRAKAMRIEYTVGT